MKKILSFFVFSFALMFNSLAQDCLPTKDQFKGYSCDGTFVAKSISDLSSYLTNYGFKKNKIKNLHINFDLNQVDDFQISTPCQIQIKEGKQLRAGNICMHGGLGVEIQARSTINALNLTIESFDEAIVRHDNKIHVENFKIKSYGVNSSSKVRLGFNSNVQAKNILLDSFDYSSIGANSLIKVQERFEMFSRGDLDSVIGSHSQIEADVINISARDELKIGRGTKLKANEVTLNSTQCSYQTSGVLIESPNKTGNCFLSSNPKGYLTVNKNSGEVPLQIDFSFNVPNAIKYLIDFGDGEQLETIANEASHVYQSCSV